jgi:hypothetical protein
LYDVHNCHFLHRLYFVNHFFGDFQYRYFFVLFGQVREALNRPLERRKRQELTAAAELRVMTGVDIILSTLSSCLSQAS